MVAFGGAISAGAAAAAGAISAGVAGAISAGTDGVCVPSTFWLSFFGTGAGVAFGSNSAGTAGVAFLEAFFPPIGDFLASAVLLLFFDSSACSAEALALASAPSLIAPALSATFCSSSSF